MSVDVKQTIESPFSVSIGIDPLFTEAYLSYGQKTVFHKVASTQNDIATTVLQVLKQAGCAIGFQDLHELLVSVPIIRLCTSIVHTGMLLHLGQPIGLLVSAELVESGRRVLAALGLPSDMVIDIAAPHVPQAAEKLRLAFNRLLNLGARCIGVCLTGSWRNPMDEQLILLQIDRQYPPQYLGSVPVLLASDYETGLTDEERIVALAIDCYMRRTLSNHINALRSALAREGFSGALLVAEDSGLSPVSRVRPSKTVMAPQSAFFSVASYWIKQAGTRGIALEIGSYSSELAIIDRRDQTNTPFASLLPENTMGGIASKLKRQSGRFVLTTPDNLTAPGENYPDWKEQAPSFLEAIIVLGYISPYSLRTRFLSDRSAANSAMAGLIGQGASTIEAAAFRAYHDVVDDLTRLIRRQIKQREIDAATSAFLVCGEAGGVFACAIAERLGCNVIYTIPGSVMTLTMGAMLMELKQQFRYRLGNGMNIQEPSILRLMINRLKQQSERILHGSHLENLPVYYQYGLEYAAKDDNVVQYLYHKIDELQPVSIDPSTGRLLDSDIYEPVALTLQLTGALTKASGGFENIRKQGYGINPNSEQMRKVYLGPGLGWYDCRVYWLPDFGEGEVLPGPVLIEDVESVYWVPSGWHYVVGNKGMDRIERG